MEKTKLKKSVISIIMYVVAAIFVLYALYQIKSSVDYLSQTFQQYGMSISSNMGDAITYIVNSCIGSFAYALIMLGIAAVYREVRKLKPENYVVVRRLEKTAEEAQDNLAAEVALPEEAEAAEETEEKTEAEIDEESVEKEADGNC